MYILINQNRFLKKLWNRSLLILNGDPESKSILFTRKTIFAPDRGQIRIECEADDYFLETVFITELTNIKEILQNMYFHILNFLFLMNIFDVPFHSTLLAAAVITNFTFEWFFFPHELMKHGFSNDIFGNSCSRTFHS